MPVLVQGAGCLTVTARPRKTRGPFFSEGAMQPVGKNMTLGSPLKLILALSLPLMVANAFQQL